jgi:hypothetical protein
MIEIVALWKNYNFRVNEKVRKAERKKKIKFEARGYFYKNRIDISKYLAANYYKTIFIFLKKIYPKNTYPLL